MLNVTIVKNRHAGEEDARALEARIKKCDVLAFEQGYGTEDHAKTVELWFEHVRKRQVGQKELLTALNPDDDPYTRQLLRGVMRSGKPVWLVERFTSDERTRLKGERREKGNRYHEEVDKVLVEFKRDFRNFDPGIAACRTYLYELARWEQRHKIFRDEHIARNIDRAEDAIRERYPSFHRVKNLKFAVIIGRIHRPEDYVTNPDVRVSVVDDTIVEEVTHLEDVPPFFLRKHYEGGNEEELLPLTYLTLLHFSLEQGLIKDVSPGDWNSIREKIYPGITPSKE